MKAKKIAVYGMIVLAVCVALCIFFAGTIRSIATAKVRLTTPKSGKLTQTVQLTGKLAFTSGEDVKLDIPDGVTLDIKAVNMEVGFEVEEGDVLIEAGVSDYAASMNALRASYNETSAALSALDEKDITLRRTEEAWAEAYAKHSDAIEVYLDCELELKALERIEGVSGDSDDASDALKAAYQAKTDAQTARDEAKTALDAAGRYAVSDESREYITQKYKLEKQLAQQEDDMLALRVLNSSVSEIRAPMDGYITEVSVKPGDTFGAAAVAYVICPVDEKPVIRVDITKSELTITKGMDCTYPAPNGGYYEGRIDYIGAKLDGTKYADIELSKGDIKDMGGVYALAQAEFTVSVEYKARATSTLLPSSAVRGSGNERYVLIVRGETNAFGTTRMKLVKMTVTVLAESNGTVSVEEDVTYQSVAYMEDRPISEGDSVMEYEE